MENLSENPSMAAASLTRRAVIEGLGTAFLLATIVGSGMMAQQLAGGNMAVMLLAGSLASGAILVVLITAFGPISGAYVNPVLTLVEAWNGAVRWGDVPAYIAAQFAGGFAGVALANLMFQHPPLMIAQNEHSGMAQLLGEFVATFGLITVILGTQRHRPDNIPTVVGLYILAASWFTSSTSFANPAVTLARIATDTLTGIRPADVPGFIAAQVLGGAAALLLFGKRK